MVMVAMMMDSGGGLGQRLIGDLDLAVVMAISANVDSEVRDSGDAGEWRRNALRPVQAAAMAGGRAAMGGVHALTGASGATGDRWCDDGRVGGRRWWRWYGGGGVMGDGDARAMAIAMTMMMGDATMRRCMRRDSEWRQAGGRFARRDGLMLICSDAAIGV